MLVGGPWHVKLSWDAESQVYSVEIRGSKLQGWGLEDVIAIIKFVNTILFTFSYYLSSNSTRDL